MSSAGTRATCRQLADKLVASWHAHDCVPLIPPDSDEVLHSRRLVAHRCLYGVDRNPIAVDLAKLSLWLATLARDHAFTFLDHALRCGDSLVGLTPDQIVAFHWSPGREKDYVTRGLLRRKLDEAEQFRSAIRDASDDADVATLRHMLREADDALDDLRLAGDLVVLAFFSARNAKERQARRNGLAQEVWGWQQGANATHLRAMVDDMRREQRVNPFHWQIEFPEVFDRAARGFDCLVGNPPFLGGFRITEVAAGPEYQHWLKALVAPAKGQVDLCVFFFHRAFSLLRDGGALGMLATDTIAFGDNRLSGLAQLLDLGGTIFCATTGLTWPGEAAVLVSVIHIGRGSGSFFDGMAELNHERCAFINSKLQASKVLGEPTPLTSNESLAFNGTAIGGSGFVLDAAEAAPFLKVSENRSVLLPLTGGDEVNGPPSAHNSRYVISFGRRSLEEAAQWPELLALVRDRVLPQRMTAKDHGPGMHGKKYWWQHVLRRDPLYEAIAGLTMCLVTAQVSTHHAIRFEAIGRLFNHKVFVFAFDQYAALAILQSSAHMFWSLAHSSRHGMAVNYSVSKAFDTFPFPEDWRAFGALESAGRTYNELRNRVMSTREEGLTATYNRFHDPAERDVDILQLRDLHAAMDRAVLDAYGWNDIPAEYDFLVDREVDGEGVGPKRPRRYRWRDEVREEVLARLLVLNGERAEAERLRGDGAESSRALGAAADSTQLLIEEA